MTLSNRQTHHAPILGYKHGDLTVRPLQDYFAA
jgi:hypothetical protein